MQTAASKTVNGFFGCRVAAMVWLGAGCCTMQLAHAADLTVREIAQTLFQTEQGGQADFSGKNLGGLDLAGLDFKSARLAGVDFYGAELADANLAGSDLRGARLDRATLTRVEFSGANLEHATILRASVFSGLTADHREAPRFKGARMAGVQIFGRMDYADFRWADLSGAIFGGKNPRDENTSLARVNLFGADFSEATLKDAVLRGSRCTFARFINADLRGADFTDADLAKADFMGADLTGADVTGADLADADFTGAKGMSELKGLAAALNAEHMRVP